MAAELTRSDPAQGTRRMLGCTTLKTVTGNQDGRSTIRWSASCAIWAPQQKGTFGPARTGGIWRVRRAAGLQRSAKLDVGSLQRATAAHRYAVFPGRSSSPNFPGQHRVDRHFFRGRADSMGFNYAKDQRFDRLAQGARLFEVLGNKGEVDRPVSSLTLWRASNSAAAPEFRTVCRDRRCCPAASAAGRLR